MNAETLVNLFIPETTKALEEWSATKAFPDLKVHPVLSALLVCLVLMVLLELKANE